MTPNDQRIVDDLLRRAREAFAAADRCAAEDLTELVEWHRERGNSELRHAYAHRLEAAAGQPVCTQCFQVGHRRLDGAGCRETAPQPTLEDF